MNVTMSNVCCRCLIPLLGGLALFAGTVSALAGDDEPKEKGRELFRLPAGKIITAVTFSSDGKQILTGNGLRALMQWDAKTGKELRRWAGQQAEDCVIVTTQKDLVKLRISRLAGRPLWALRIGLDIVTGREVLEERLRSVL